MIDLNNINNLITALRTEIEADSISPDRLGNILSQMTDAMSNLDTTDLREDVRTALKTAQEASKSISTEVIARTDADTLLNTAIQTETKDRTIADTQLCKDIQEVSCTINDLSINNSNNLIEVSDITSMINCESDIVDVIFDEKYESLKNALIIKHKEDRETEYYPQERNLIYLEQPNNLTLSYWAGNNQPNSENDVYSQYLRGKVYSVSQIEKTLYSIVIKNIRGGLRDSVIQVLDDGHNYDLISNNLIIKNCDSSLTTDDICESITAIIDGYKDVDGTIMFHYLIQIKNLCKVNVLCLSLIGGFDAKLLKNEQIVFSDIMAFNSTNVAGDILQGYDSINNAVKYDTLQFCESYEHDNLIIDKFNGIGKLCALDTDFTIKEDCVLHPFYIKSVYNIDKKQRYIINPITNRQIILNGYSINNDIDNTGRPLRKYLGNQNSQGSASSDNVFIDIIPQNISEVDTYSFQFWIDLDELNGNGITRVFSYQLIRFDINNAKKGQKFNINGTKDWHNSPILMEIVERIGNMVCICAHDVKNTRNAWSIYKTNDIAVGSVTIYNPTLLQSDCAIDPFFRYESCAEKQGGRLYGKKVILIGDSQYNNTIVAYNMCEKMGANVYDMHYGGHTLRYNNSTAVNQISKSWFYQRNYRDLVLSIKDADYYILTMSSNDCGGGGELTDAAIAAVEANYPTISDANDTASSKIKLFDAMSESDKARIFAYQQVYAAYIKQMLIVSPRAKVLLCSIPISCSGYLTGQAVPNPTSVSESIGQWADGKNPDVARAGLDDKWRTQRNQVKNIADRFCAEFIDLYSCVGLTYENFIYHCYDGTHWSKDIAYNIFNSLI